MIRLSNRVLVFALCVLAATLAVSASAQTYTELLSFNGNTAAGPRTPLTQGIDGSLYGTTYYGGTGNCFDGQGIGCGVVFRLNHTGQFQILYNFQNSGITNPVNDLVLGADGNLYGTAPNGYGVIFKITPAGSLTTVYTFTGGLTGGRLNGGLTLGVDGNFYGTTYLGGTPSNSCPDGCGTIYKMTPAGVVTTLYSFCPQNYCPDGENPAGTLAQGADGNFYGTALYGGLYKRGTIFKITPDGAFTLLYTDTNDNFSSTGGLILATDGNFYGPTGDDLFRITPQGTYTALADFGDPSLPIQGTDGNLYGTAQGGNYGYGEVFQVPLNGNSSILYSFAGYPTDGSTPLSGLVQHTNGKFYGTTYTGGGSPCNYGSYPGCGTIFSLDMGLAPFVAFVNRAGKVGWQFGLLGQGFTGTTGVSLNGTPASFIVKSDTLLIATVPAGASTGLVTVTAPGGTLTSNVQFVVIP